MIPECLTIMALVGNKHLGVLSALQPMILAKEEPRDDHHHYRL
jgi:hypothetical protein